MKYVALVGTAFIFPAVLQAAPIHLQPGQCIMVGSQEVCALRGDAPSAVNTAPPTISYVCRYGMHKEAEIADLKSYQLVKVTTKADGTSSETTVKNFGMNGQESCEKEADRREAKTKE